LVIEDHASLAICGIAGGERLAAREGWAIAGILKRQPSTAENPYFGVFTKSWTDLEVDYLTSP